MLQTQVFSSFTQRPARGLVRFTAMATFVGGSYGLYWHQSRKCQLEKKYERVGQEFTEWKPIPIESSLAVNYPWVYENINEWENKLVKMYGYFRDERFFIRRQRDGRDGYLVFAAFITSQQNLSHNGDQVANSQIMVNLGWVPAENKRDVQMGSEPIGTWSGEGVNPLEGGDHFTGFTKNVAKLPEDQKLPFTELVGLVKRGESQNILRGRRNWVMDCVYNYVDLWYMSRFLRSFNLGASSIAYIERVVPELDEESATMYPIPATKDTWVKDVITTETHQNLSVFYGVSSVLSIAVLLLRR